jgi:ubiquitin C-terminal hydrolase
MKICKENKILNPKTNLCVKKNGIIGKKILLDNEIIPIFWENNSCYLDSILVSLFHYNDINNINYPLINYKNKTLNIKAENIKNELFKIFEIISQRKISKKRNNCSLLRTLLNDFYKKLIKIYPEKATIFKNENWINSQLDVFEFLNLFDNIFNIPNSLKFREGTNLHNSNFFYNIPIDLLINKNKVFIKKIFPSFKIKNNKLIIKTTLLKADKLFLKIFRNLGDYKLETKIIPSKTLKLPDNNFDLHLNSIIIHYGNIIGGHYICLYKLNDKWFEYDDMNLPPTYIGSLNKIIQNDNYISNIVGLLYSK